MGSLFSFDLDGKVVTQVDKVDISNGLAWTADNKTFYYIDSLSDGVDAFDFDLAAGKLSMYLKFLEL